MTIRDWVVDRYMYHTSQRSLSSHFSGVCPTTTIMISGFAGEAVMNNWMYMKEQ